MQAPVGSRMQPKRTQAKLDAAWANLELRADKASISKARTNIQWRWALPKADKSPTVNPKAAEATANNGSYNRSESTCRPG